MTYLCYDIRGIQSFIFRIPKLKYIIGGSALIDQFDRETVHQFDRPDTELLFAGGGKGTFSCSSEDLARGLQKLLCEKAHEIGLDIRFGLNEKYEEASKNATEIYPFIPDNLEGKPCNTSGLYPVTGGDEHPVVKKRIYAKGEKTFRWFEKRLLEGDDTHIGLRNELPEEYREAEFFHDVKSELGSKGSEGAAALGDRNRWAIICMDGNDMGMQMQEKLKELKEGRITPEQMPQWLKAMSSAIDSCSFEATKAGIKAVFEKWKDSDDAKKDKKFLPLRPLVVGGDDITVLCHCSYAMDFVKAAMAKFNEHSKIEDAKAKNGDLKMSVWPATNGEISISAGVLFAPVTLPLHSAMAYTEALLASAKTRGRKENKKPSVPCVDWEFITNSVIDTPAAHRQRELIFIDEDLGKEVHLTSRPCTMDEFNHIESLCGKYATLPRNVLLKVLPSIRKCQNDRMEFVAEIAKHQPLLASHLQEDGFELPSNEKAEHSLWNINGNSMTTTVIDAVLLLEEQKRMQKETNND